MDYSKVRLADLEAKHMFIPNETEVWFDFVRAGYRNALLGANNGMSAIESVRYIYKMIEDNYTGIVGVIETCDGKLWCDNTHTAISYIRRESNKHLTLNDVPSYVISYIEEPTIVFSNTNIESLTGKSLNTIIEHSNRRNKYVKDDKLRQGNITYTISNLINDINYYTTPDVMRKHIFELNNKNRFLEDILRLRKDVG